MARLVKFLLILVLALVGIGVVASVVIALFFDPNDFRDEISTAVKKTTGREVVIEGELSLSIFPWLAVEIGRTRLGNAEGFGDEPFMSFEEARLSVRLLPLILRQEVAIGTASLDSLHVNLAVDKNGVSNWDDLAEAGEAAPEPAAPAADSASRDFKLDIANVRVSNANVSYSDAQAGTSAAITNLIFNTGRIAAGSPFDIEATFEFDAQPDGIGGQLSIGGEILFTEGFGRIDIDGLSVFGILRGITDDPTEFNFDARAIGIDADAESIDLGEMDMGIFGIGMTANVDPFSYAGDPQPVATVQVREFSLKDLMQTFGIEPPPTADPNAMQRVGFSAKAAVRRKRVALSDMELVLDDTNMRGTLSLPKKPGGRLKFDLHVDSIVVDHYMAPASEETAAAESAGDDANVEIPVDLIRALNAKGLFRMDKATLGGMVFEDMELGLNSKNGKLRLHPISARMFDGKYKGDVRIDARTDNPTISVDERIVGVQLEALANAMYGVENVSGTIKGRFRLSGSGADINAIRDTLGGDIRFELADGEFQGTDVWYELRNARALLKQEQPPEARTPPRTEFTNVLLAGTVTNGVMMTDDLLAELPFLRMTGDGAVSFVDATIDAAVEARVVENPEFAGQVSEAELEDFTAAVIPMKVSGPLASPSIKPDIEALLRQEVERQVEEKTEELKKRLFDSLLGGEDEPAEDEAGQEGEEEQQEEEEPDPEDLLKEAVKDIFGD